MFVRSSEKVISDGPVRKKNRKTSEKSDGVSVVRKNSVAEKNRESTELWTKVVGRREKKHNSERREKKQTIRRTERNVARKKEPLKTSAVIITARAPRTIKFPIQKFLDGPDRTRN